MKKIYSILPAVAAGLMFASCENGTQEFPDFDYQTVYFATQYADRTIELGVDDNVDLTDDNNHVCRINSAWGGGYTNRNNVAIDYVVDPTLVDGLFFKGTDTPVEIMPSEYYTLGSEQIIIPSGKIMGGVEVQLTDAFFNDPRTVGHAYVIPLRMTNVQGADSILSGLALQENPVLTNDAHWSVQPKNFVLYSVKYVNKWHGQYLRRGVDEVTIDGVTTSAVRHEQYVENDEVVDLSTAAFRQDVLPITVKDAAGNNITFELTFNFNDGDDTFTLTSAADNVRVSGSGKFVSKGEKNSLGGKDRDAIYMDYTAELLDHNMKFATSDTLVLHTRNVYGAGTLGVERH